ncbi:MAG TPA: hypothetical protein EYP56_17485, partial [Planctomycetaceae bacterium]|nr:hypothetical protein [Planctomycetaceae bacterium]
QVAVIRRPNRGLCSLNDVVAELDGPVAMLLNNDIKLAPGAVDPLVAPLFERASSCFMAAPRSWLFDGRTYEGFKTAVRWRWGLVQATALYPGHEAGTGQAGWTASAGAALAVRTEVFLQLGGFDPLYLPGRLEDLDFSFRGWMAGYHAEYVPAAVAYHRGMATFGAVFGGGGCDHLALRNTLLFHWKNLRDPRHRLRHWAGVALRLARDAVHGAGRTGAGGRSFWHAFSDALARWRKMGRHAIRPRGDLRREREFFVRFHPCCIDLRHGQAAPQARRRGGLAHRPMGRAA